MSDDTLPFCSICRNVDVRSLLFAAREESKHKRLPAWDDLDSNKNLSDDSPLFFKHQTSILDLRRGANRCELCGEIWRSFRMNAGLSEDISESYLSSGLSDSPIYVTANLEASQFDRLPKLILFQHQQHVGSRLVGSFDICTKIESEPTDCHDRFARVMLEDTGSLEAMKLAKGWLETCQSQHSICKQKRSKVQPPTRLIDLQNGARLINAKGNEEFVALSYSWGGESAKMLEKQTENEFRTAIPPEALPPTMLDAIPITKSLDLIYLWIDAICIFQDSAEDFANETSKMRDIYRGAVITINGTSQAKISDRLLVKRSLTHIRLPWNNPNRSSQCVYLREDSQATQTYLKTAHVNTRAWCLQESLLATRSLWIGEQQMMFECATDQVDESGRRAVATEDYRSKRFIYELSKGEHARGQSFMGRLTSKSLPPHLAGPNGRKITLFDYWREIVHQFSLRGIQCPTTAILPALSGLADAFERATGEVYLAGIWKADLIRSLNWNRQLSVEYYNATAHAKLVEEHRHSGYSGPSWSWPSVPFGTLKFSPAMPNMSISELDFKTKDELEIIDAWTQVSTVDKNGHVSAGELILRGPIIEIPDPQIPADPKYVLPALHKYLHGFISVAGTNSFEFRLKHGGHENQRFALLQTCVNSEVMTDITQAELLLIETCSDNDTAGKVDSSQSASQCWQRVAHFAIRTSGPSPAGLDTQELRDDMNAIPWRLETLRLI